MNPFMDCYVLASREGRLSVFGIDPFRQPLAWKPERGQSFGPDIKDKVLSITPLPHDTWLIEKVLEKSSYYLMRHIFDMGDEPMRIFDFLDDCHEVFENMQARKSLTRVD